MISGDGRMEEEIRMGKASRVIGNRFGNGRSCVAGTGNRDESIEKDSREEKFG